MKSLLKNLGVIFVLVGVAFFVVYSFKTSPSNALLLTGLIFEVVGVIGYIVINKLVD